VTLTTATGSSASTYGFSGEYTSNNLVYLRARQYAPGMGRFLTRDTWGGDANSPMSYNKWSYVGSNPVNRTDPTGRCWYPKQGGGINYDFSDMSPALCSWFINTFQNNGITIPANATPQNWLSSVPPEHQAIIAAYTTCPFQNNTFIGAGGDIWQVVVFWTRPRWHFFNNSSTVNLKVDLTLIGTGGEVVFACNNDSDECTGSYNYSVGIGLSKYDLDLKVGGEIDISNKGEVQVGAAISGGPLSVFVSPTKVSVAGTIVTWDKLGAGQQFELGWQKDDTDIFWVFANISKFRNLSYEQFANLNLPFRDKNEKIYYQIKDTGSERHLFQQYTGVFTENHNNFFRFP